MNINSKVNNSHRLNLRIVCYTIFCTFFLYQCEEETKTKSPKEINPPTEIKTKTSVEDFSSIKNKTTTFDIYHLSAPNQKLKLSKKLLEISGLSMAADDNHLLAVNDEQAYVFILEKKTGEIIHKIDFGKRGDYEAIEKVGEEVYVVKSNGKLYKMLLKEEADLKEEEIETEKYETIFTSKNDIEGMAYDKKNNQLLIACKGEAGIGEQDEFENVKAIYAFDLERKELQTIPKYLIEISSLQQKLKDETQVDSAEDRIIYQTAKKRLDKFSPSGIAIHPKNQDIYILSSVGKILLILNLKGEVKNVIFLDKEIFKQPEGICFDKAGTLYVSSEGRNTKASILVFEEHKAD